MTNFISTKFNWSVLRKFIQELPGASSYAIHR